MFAALAALWLQAGSVSAQTCIDDVWKAHDNSQNLTCTANDVRVASAGNIRDVALAPLAQCVAGQYFSFVADFTVVLGAQARYDIGLYFATDGDPDDNGALSGTCDANIITAVNAGTGLGSPNFFQLDAPPDVCGDINSSHNPQIVTVRVDNALCIDTDGDGTLNLPNCTSWRTSGNNELCQTSFDSYPGSPSKCNCDIGFNVPIFVESGTIEVTKMAAPLSQPEPGGTFTFTVNVTNTAAFTDVTIDKICDDHYGTVAGTGCPDGTLGTIGTTDCAVPTVLAPGGSYECSFTGDVFSDVPTTSTDTVTVSGVDENDDPVSDTASAQVAIDDVAPTALVTKSLDSLVCSDVKYHVKVENTSTAESLTLTVLSDDGFGSLTSVHDDVLATTCSVPQSIAEASSYECDFTAHFCGDNHTNQITATVTDDDGGSLAEASNSLSITVGAQTQP